MISTDKIQELKRATGGNMPHSKNVAIDHKSWFQPFLISLKINSSHPLLNCRERR
jgi:hypothetical protein